MSIKDFMAHIKRGLIQSITGNIILFIWGIAFIQFILFPIVFNIKNPINSSFWLAIFTVQPDHLSYIWTYTTSVFSHGGLIHLFINTLVLASFGFPAEKIIGKKKYIIFFLLTGTLSAFSQAFIFNYNEIFLPILGSSGAIAAIIGAFTIFQPKAKVYFFFIFKRNLWESSILFIIITIIPLLFFGFGAFGIAHTAHLIGFFLGAGYATYITYRNPDIKLLENTKPFDFLEY